MKRFPDDNRTEEQIREHYEIEKQLAARLRSAPKQERRDLYGVLYDELYRRVPHHPRHTRAHTAKRATHQIAILEQFLNRDSIVLEVGAGTCDTLCAVAERVRRAIGVEVSVTTAHRSNFPPNLELLKFDGIEMPLPPKSVDLAYSMAVIEHLHPDDAFDQMKSVATTLKPGGSYVLTTPHRFIGPTDISKYFDRVAVGFHLHEYTFFELWRMMRRAGFTRLRNLAYLKGRYWALPAIFPISAELCLAGLSYGLRKKTASVQRICQLFGIKAIATR